LPTFGSSGEKRIVPDFVPGFKFILAVRFLPGIRTPLPWPAHIREFQRFSFQDSASSAPWLGKRDYVGRFLVWADVAFRLRSESVVGAGNPGDSDSGLVQVVVTISPTDAPL
jgi:membrane protein DedA with SNARE-associated domain